jgi:pilus assembly protein CpaB
VPADDVLDDLDARVARARRALRRVVRRHRRLLGAVLLAWAAVLALAEVSPPPPPTRPVVVAAHDLPTGLALTVEDVQVMDVPEAVALPLALAEPQDVSGQVLAGPVLAGEPLTPARFQGPALLSGQPRGVQALPVRVADAGAAEVLRPGDRIDVLAALADGRITAVRVVAANLPVLVAPTPQTDTDGGLVGGLATGAGDLGGGLVVVAASPPQVRALVGAASEAPLWFSLRER